MRQIYYWLMLVLCAVVCNVTVGAQSKLDSPEKLRDAFLAARKAGNVEAAMKLFCPAKTGKWVLDMYRRSVESAVTLPLVSATVGPLSPDKKPKITHSAEPLGRLVFVFDTSKQKGFAIEQLFLYFGRVENGYCFAMPIAPERT